MDSPIEKRDEREEGEAESGDDEIRGSDEEGEDIKPEGDSDDDEDEDEDEEINEEDLKFIADDDEEESDIETAEKRKKRKKEKKEKRKRSEEIEQLSDDDLDLINENIGRRSKKKLRKKGDEDRDDLADMFNDEELDDIEPSKRPKDRKDIYDDDLDDLDDFIIRDDSDGDEDDEDRRKERRQIKQKRQEFAKNLGSEHGISDKPGQVLTEEDYNEDAEVPTVTKQTTIKDIWEPSAIAAGMLTEQDELIRIRDVPERYQSQESAYIPDDAEIAREAALHAKTLMRDHQNITENSLVTAITCVLRFIRRDRYEVPFIWAHRRDYFDGILNRMDLWKIVDLDEKFIEVELKKKQLIELILQIATVSPEIEHDTQIAGLVEKIVSLDDVTDTFAHIKLMYSIQLNQLEANGKQRRLFKKAPWKRLYDDAMENGIGNFAKLFNINQSDFINSVTGRQSLHFPENHDESPLDAAASFVCQRFPTPELVLKAGKNILSRQISIYPELRAFVRKVYKHDAVVVVEPTEKGLKEIDQFHPYHPFKFLRDKPVADFVNGQFLQILKGETDGLLKVSIRVEGEAELIGDFNKFICNDYVDEKAVLWNAERQSIAEDVCVNILFPQTVKWLKEHLALIASDDILNKCHLEMERKINMSPYKPGGDGSRSPTKPGQADNPCVVLSICWGDGTRNDPAFAVILKDTGEIQEYIRLDKLTDRDNVDDTKALLQLVQRHEPDVIAVGGFKPNTKTLLLKILEERVVGEGLNDRSLKYSIPVMIVEDETARIFMNSQTGLKEFPASDYHMLIRYCVSLGRYVQDPTTEYAALFNQDQDIKSVRLHPLQALVAEESLLKAIERSFINIVNECGVDINTVSAFPHLAGTLQFVSGLGPRKAQAMIAKINRQGSRLESRAALVQLYICGSTIFVNCASFIRIRDFHFAAGYRESQYDILDDSRVHPEDYDLARKMAADALDVPDAMEEDEDPSAHVLELMTGDVTRLDSLLLDEYAVELERRMHAPKRVCLNDIKQELMHRFQDRRMKFAGATPEQIFSMLTGESLDTLYDSVVTTLVVRVKERFLSCQLGSGLEGSIHISKIDTDGRSDLTQLFSENQALITKVMNVNLDRLQVDLSAKQEDIEDVQLKVDKYFDSDKQRIKQPERKKKMDKVERVVRTIQHPFWQSVNYRAAEAYLATRPRGEVVVRPSDILESQKPNEWTLGKILTIDNLQFSEIDQIIAEYIEPMIRKASELIDHPKYQRKTLNEMYDYVNEQSSVLKRSAYGFIISQDKQMEAGTFLLVFRHPNNRPRKEIIRVHPSAFEFRSKRFKEINQLLDYFKTSEAEKVKAKPLVHPQRQQHIGQHPPPDNRQRLPDRHAPNDRRRDYNDPRRGPPQRSYGNSYPQRNY
ncbi:Transcription elongation factor spt6 [Globomyces sp. JEL0801]|nr:Transcription elongation factor spt6 [Globomyces sp. JEL0801]